MALLSGDDEELDVLGARRADDAVGLPTFGDIAGRGSGRPYVDREFDSKLAEIRRSVSMLGLISPSSKRATCGCFIARRSVSSR